MWCPVLLLLSTLSTLLSNLPQHPNNNNNNNQQLTRHGFTAPTFIQAQAWPIAFEGRDLVAIASTGGHRRCHG